MLGTSGDWLVQTKLQPPGLPRSDLVKRQRLTEALRATVMAHRITLISARAGAGKTTLVAAAFAAEPAVACAWLSLDDEDGDPGRFLALLIAALRRLEPACGATASALLASLNHPGHQVRQVIGALINDVVATLPGPAVLVIEDLHLIAEPAAYVALDYLLERLPPQLHLLVTTRHDPPLALARLRARGHLAELRYRNLRFTAEEAAAFLNEQVGLALSSTDLSLAHAHTEGWAAGLRLLAGTLTHLDGAQQRQSFLSGLTRVDRHGFDYLAAEVLQRQPPDIRRFLLETSILTELTPELAQAVTDRADAGSILDELAGRDLFVVRLDRTVGDTRLGPAYRYHALFAAFLRATLVRELPAQVAELHRRAAAAHPVPGQAIAHLIAAGEWEAAAGRIEAIGDDLLQRGFLDTVHGWIEALPAEIRDARPRLLYLLGVCTWRRGSAVEAVALLGRAVQAADRRGDTVTQGQALPYLLAAAFVEGSAFRLVPAIGRALSGPVLPADRVRLLIERARLDLMRGNPANIAADVDAALDLAETSPDAAVLPALVMHLYPSLISELWGLDRLERVFALASARAGEAPSLFRAAVEAQWSLVHFWRGRLGDCIEAGERALALRAQVGTDNPLLDLWLLVRLALAHTSLGSHAEARPYFDQMFTVTARLGLDGGMIAPGLYVWGWARWLQGDAPETRRTYERLAAMPTNGSVALLMARATLHGLVLLSDRDYEGAAESLRTAITLHQRYPYLVASVDPRLLLAHLYLEQGRAEPALAEFVPVVDECAARGTPGVILREGALMVPLLRLAARAGHEAAFVARLLDVLGEPPPPDGIPVPWTGATLSAREVELLRLLSTGASNRLIAAQLTIGVSTVKTHLLHIFQKLDVETRTQAVARARDLGLQ